MVVVSYGAFFRPHCITVMTCVVKWLSVEVTWKVVLLPRGHRRLIRVTKALLETLSRTCFHSLFSWVTFSSWREFLKRTTVLSKEFFMAIDYICSHFFFFESRVCLMALSLSLSLFHKTWRGCNKKRWFYLITNEAWSREILSRVLRSQESG